MRLCGAAPRCLRALGSTRRWDWLPRVSARCNRVKRKLTWRRWRDETHDAQSYTPRQSERGTDLREILGGKGGLEASAAGCSGGGHGGAARWRGEKRFGEHARGQ